MQGTLFNDISARFADSAETTLYSARRYKGRDQNTLKNEPARDLCRAGSLLYDGFFIIKQKPPAMPVDKRKTTQALAAERSRYTKKLLCAKLNVRLATVHK